VKQLNSRGVSRSTAIFYKAACAGTEQPPGVI
jgi:hypothetical protein